jgi:hypothetical protein
VEQELSFVITGVYDEDGVRGDRLPPVCVRDLDKLVESGELDGWKQVMLQPQARPADVALSVMADLCRLGCAHGWYWVEAESELGPQCWLECDGWVFVPGFLPTEEGAPATFHLLAFPEDEFRQRTAEVSLQVHSRLDCHLMDLTLHQLGLMTPEDTDD